ncbi:MAG: glycosyltransferase family 2 protein [Melioribacteraceae bacterium]
MKNSIYIIIPVHNRKEFTRNCLLSLRKQTYKEFKIVIIDDGSTDGTAEMLENEFPEVHVIKGDGNLWWTAATNLGVKYALENNADYILTLNNDTIATEEFLEKMIYWAKKTPNALLGAFAIDADTKKPVYGGEIINWKWANSKFLLDILPKEQWHGLHEVTHFPGRGLLIPADVFRKIGLYNQKHFPHYAADYDFTLRACKEGYKIFCNYEAKIYIFPNCSSSEEIRNNFSFINYLKHLTSIKGSGNIKIFIIYSLKHCPRIYLINYLIIGLLKRFLGMPLKSLKKYISKINEYILIK